MSHYWEIYYVLWIHYATTWHMGDVHIFLSIIFSHTRCVCWVLQECTDGYHWDPQTEHCKGKAMLNQVTPCFSSCFSNLALCFTFLFPIRHKRVWDHSWCLQGGNEVLQPLWRLPVPSPLCVTHPCSRASYYTRSALKPMPSRLRASGKQLCGWVSGLWVWGLEVDRWPQDEWSLNVFVCVVV